MLNSNFKYLNSIHMIARMLYCADVPFWFNGYQDGAQLTFPWCGGEVICYNDSIGCDSGDVETRHFPWDKKGSFSVLTIDETFQEISKYYRKKLDN